MHGTIHGGEDIIHGTDRHGTGITATGTILGTAAHGMIHGMATDGTTLGGARLGGIRIMVQDSDRDGILHLIHLMGIMGGISIMANVTQARLMREDQI